ncbi:MAG: iron-containing redox enzyme family protein [Candidatus Melainabacteria bacterium]|nr:iron-containing redox enzyme family protein [Candidatus Melainabacteria bacterium]
MQLTLPRKAVQKITITPHPEWAQNFWDNLVPLKDKVSKHPFFKEVEAGTLPLELGQKALIDFYPLVENFPKYMALNLAKTKRELPGHKEAKFWLIQNIKVEQNHADWWHFWSRGFNVTDEQLIHAKPSPYMDAINNFLWNINTNSSLAEGLAATNLAVEWATGEWTINVIEGVKSYSKNGNITVDDRVMSWLNAHATYDDEHPYEAMEIIKMVATTEAEREKAFEAAQRSLEYYILALDDCYSAVTKTKVA